MFAPPTAIMQELHKLHSSGAIIYLAALPAYSIYLARSLMDVVWNGTTYQKFWFEIDAIGEDADKHAPELQLQISNIGGYIEQEVIANDNFAGATVTLYVVNSNCLDETEPVYEVQLQIEKVSVTRNVVTFTLGLPNPLYMAFPSWKFHDSLCQYKVFKGDLCGYTGSDTTCARTLAACIAKNNVERFGAQPGLLGAIQNDL